jgi:hypothetical protein
MQPAMKAQEQEQAQQPAPGWRQRHCVAVVYWLLSIGYWLLAIVYCLLAIGYWLLSIGYWLLKSNSRSALAISAWVSPVLQATHKQRPPFGRRDT